jgi:hypothetical protein
MRNLWLFIVAAVLGAGAAVGAARLAHHDAPAFQQAAAPVVTSKAGPAGIRRPWQGSGTIPVGTSPTSIPPGAYIVTAEGGANGCYWARLSRNDAATESIIDQGHFERGGYSRPVIHPHDRYFRINGCTVEPLG